VEVDQLGGEPLAVSRRVIVDWTAFSPMVREQRTPPPADVELEVVPTPDDDLTEGEWNGAPEEDDEDEDIDRSLTTVGDPRPDATL
jgi:hypothetical protein